MRCCNPRLALLVASSVIACSTEEALAPVAPLNPPPQPQPQPPPSPLPPLAAAPQLSTARTLTVRHAVRQSPDRTPNVPAQLDRMLADGYGELDVGPGQPLSPATLNGAAPPAPGRHPKLLTRFVYLADTQLADDESPARLAAYDAPGASAAAFRPHEGHECRILNAAVRTINALHRSAPVDFVLLGGDNADNAQSNEVGWFMAILDGADRVECDSGKNDDPVPGPDNDPKDPFFAEGLVMPWRWVTGNHDILQQGGIPIAGLGDIAVGEDAIGGTRDWSQAGAPVVTGPVAPDPRRALVDRSALLDQVSATRDGHGIGEAEKRYGKAFYWFDVERTPLRIVVLDTAAETGGPGGILRKADIDGFVRPALDRAKRDGRWVILTSHHASRLLGDGSFAGLPPQPDAISATAWRSLVGRYDNVLVHLAGHAHVHRVTKTAPPGGHPYWELETASLADYPHQMRVMEIWDQDDGFVSIRGVALDYVVEGDAVAGDGRRRAIVDLTSGFGKDGSGEPAGRNVELWIKKPR